MITLATAACLIVIFALLIALAWTDHKLYILPNRYNLALLIAFAAFHILTGWTYVSLTGATLGLLAGGGFLLAIRAVANQIMKMDTIGLGDVKFMMAAGFGLGIPDVFMILSVGAFFGMLHGGLLYLVQKRADKPQASLAHVNVPAGVGLCIATAGMVVFRFYGWWI